MQDLLQQVLVQERNPSPQNVAAEDFLLKNMSRHTVLTSCQAKFLETYKSKFPQARVVDLNQDPNARPRWGSTTMPTLTTNATKLMHIPSGQLFSQALTRLCFPAIPFNYTHPCS